MLPGLLLVIRPAVADEGRTIWGEDYASTVRAMKGVMRAIGVKSCLHCHVKEGGSVVYQTETENKAIARQMKAAFVDSLAARGQGEVDLSATASARRISAVYKATGDDVGILLTVLRAPEQPGGPPQSYSARVEIPKDGPLECGTCHSGNLHFVTEK